MNRDWTPQSHVSITSAGMVIEVELGDVAKSAVWMTFETDELCLRWHRNDLLKGESQFHIPPGYSPTDAKVSLANGILRIEVPPGDGSLYSKPRSMLICCKECGKHFDIVVTGSS